MGKTARRAKAGHQHPARPPDATRAPQAAPEHAGRANSATTGGPGRLQIIVMFGPVIFTGALLLFAVQPLIGRYLLPWFGGSPGVWTTCMLFFQSLLLGGYLYAHLLVRYLPVRWQVVVHAVLITAAVLTLPIIPEPTWKSADPRDPTWPIILLLGATIGLPYLVLSATSPLLQAWLVKVSPGVSPYRMFALSNLGSLLALLGYPLLMEPYLTRQQQAWGWSLGMVVFAVLCVTCAAFVWKRGTRAPADAGKAPAPAPAERMAGSAVLAAVRWMLWLGLPLVASVVLLAVTNTLSQDVAVVPFLWVLPLALYLITFIIAFDAERWYRRNAIALLLPVCTIWLIRLQWLGTSLKLVEQLAGFLVAMFVICLFCHGELARLKPEPRRLTAYYLTISLGGALGGVFVALAAPRLFDRYLELPLGLIAGAGLALLCYHISPMPKGMRWGSLFAGSAVVLLAFTFGGRLHGDGTVIDQSRSFYGVLTVSQDEPANPAEQIRSIGHGNIAHGHQFVAPELRRAPTVYYRPGSGINLAMEHFPRRENRRVGVVGLGAGVLATYGRAGDTFRFYEIDPDVERMARQHFTFLADTPARVEVVIGDARISMEQELARGESQQFDILALDAFSGDAIPTHLLTQEAFETYWRHLKPDGVLAVHISNRYLDLFHVMIRHAEHFQFLAPTFSDRGYSTWMLLTYNKPFVLTPEVLKRAMVRQSDPRVRRWTDDHVSLLRIVRW